MRANLAEPHSFFQDPVQSDLRHHRHSEAFAVGALQPAACPASRTAGFVDCSPTRGRYDTAP